MILMKTGLTFGVLLLAAVMAYGIVITAPTPEKVEMAEIATAIRTQAVTLETVRLKVRSQGAVAPVLQSDVIPEVSGKVKWVSPSLVAGGYFEAGDILLILDDSDHAAQVERGEAALARAAAEDDHARFELQRLRKLVTQQLISQSALENAERLQRIASAARREADVGLAQAQRDLARTRLRAPFDGLVRDKHVDQGQFVARGKLVATLYSTAAVEIPIPLADRQLAYLDLPLGQRGVLPAELQAPVTLGTWYGGEYYTWQGKLVRTEAVIDARSRMVNVVARVENSANPDRPPLPVGLFVNAEISGRLASDVVVLPRAVLRNDNQVLIVDGDSRLRYRDVELLRFDGDDVIISRGLAAGETVNLSPIQTVIDGMRVNPVMPGNG